jgi:hypothetical protein
VTYVRNRSQIIAINVLLSFNFAVVFNFNLFPYLREIEITNMEMAREMEKERGMEMEIGREM